MLHDSEALFQWLLEIEEGGQECVVALYYSALGTLLELEAILD